MVTSRTHVSKAAGVVVTLWLPMCDLPGKYKAKGVEQTMTRLMLMKLQPTAVTAVVPTSLRGLQQAEN